VVEPHFDDDTQMGKRVAILQSNYIPWKGYFDLISSVDEFILYDTAQFTKNDWRNRNRIKTSGGVIWLSIPVRHKFGQLIQDTTISDSTWKKKHWRTLSQAYAKAPHFTTYKAAFEELYDTCGAQDKLSNVNFQFIREVCTILGIRTSITWSRDYRLVEGRTERLVDLCKQCGASEYISGPAARNYLTPELFAQAGIQLTYMDYSRYPEYPQLYPPFDHNVSVLDLIFSTGPEAGMYLKQSSAFSASASPSGNA
jgi:hypothetical protein